MNSPTEYDIVIIGSGAAGLGLALRLAHQFNIAILCKDNLQTSASQRAQGGIAAVMSQTDSLDSHIQDTLIAGAGLCDPAVVTFTVTHAKAAIEQLIAYGIQFSTTDEGSQKTFHLTREGGHSHRRILHSQDKTGAAVVKTLLQQVQDHPNIHCFTEITAIDLLVENKTCYGLITLNNKTHTQQIIYAKATVLATGGASMAYLHTTTPGQTSGDGISIAFQAGARIANMEFNQFHPTCLYNPKGETILITEALRGEGAKLILPDGTQFMKNYDARKELAPRDIVARAIDNEMKTKNLSNVFLDISFESPEKIKTLFPYIYQKCLEFDIDITRAPIPVVPAAHYTCGGIVTNLNGETDIQKLYAIGEVACTGLHGANRMASNSLLECLVFANSAAESIHDKLNNSPSPHHTRFNLPAQQQKPILTDQITLLQKNLQTLMWNKVGIVRSNVSLTEAMTAILSLEKNFNVINSNTGISKGLIELRNMLINAKLIISAAAKRQESRGTHYNLDYPSPQKKALNTILKRDMNIEAGITLEYSEDIHSLIYTEHR